MIEAVCIDLDGVLVDFVSGFIKVVNGIWPGRMALDFQPTNWQWKEELSSEEFERVWRTIEQTENWWLSLPPDKANCSQLARWALKLPKSVEIFFVTSRGQCRGDSTSRQCRQWLRKYVSQSVVGRGNVLVVPHKRSKAELYKVLFHGIESASVDDYFRTVDESSKLENHKACLMSRPWNQNTPPDVNSGITRVSCISEFFEVVLT